MKVVEIFQKTKRSLKHFPITFPKPVKSFYFLAHFSQQHATNIPLSPILFLFEGLVKGSFGKKQKTPTSTFFAHFKITSSLTFSIYKKTK